MSQNSLGGMISEALHNIALALHLAGQKKSTVYAHRQEYLDMTSRLPLRLLLHFMLSLPSDSLPNAHHQQRWIIRTIPA